MSRQASEPVAKKKYESLIYKNHRVGSIQFNNGFYETAKKQEQEAIEKDPLFGQKIFESQE